MTNINPNRTGARISSIKGPGSGTSQIRLYSTLKEIGLPVYSNEPDDKEQARKALPYVTLSALKVTFPTKDSSTELLKTIPNPDIPSIRLYYEPKTFTDTFSNTLTDSFISSIFSGTSRLAQGLQMIGISAPEVNKIAKNTVKNIKDKIGILTGKNQNQNAQSSGTTQNSSKSNSFLKMLSSAVAGNLYQFPRIWGGSSGLLHYSFKVRLICNNPKSDESYRNSIVRPLDYILQYTLPRSTSRNFYEWPPLCTAYSPGMFSIKKGMVTDVSVEKGVGDSIGFNQRPSIIDVTITISSVYSAVVQDTAQGTDVQNLNDYLASLEDQREVGTISGISKSSFEPVNIVSIPTTPAPGKYGIPTIENSTLAISQQTSNVQLNSINALHDYTRKVGEYGNSVYNFNGYAGVFNTNSNYSNLSNLRTAYNNVKSAHNTVNESKSKVLSSINNLKSLASSSVSNISSTLNSITNNISNVTSNMNTISSSADTIMSTSNNIVNQPSSSNQNQWHQVITNNTSNIASVNNQIQSTKDTISNQIESLRSIQI